MLNIIDKMARKEKQNKKARYIRNRKRLKRQTYFSH